MKKIAELFNVTGYGAVVTGGASGIGLALTEAYAANGARVTMLDVHGQRLESEAKRLRDAGLDVRGKLVDVTDHKSLDAAVDEAAREYGRSRHRLRERRHRFGCRVRRLLGRTAAPACYRGWPRELHR